MIVMGEKRLPTSFCTTTQGRAPEVGSFFFSTPIAPDKSTSTTSPTLNADLHGHSVSLQCDSLLVRPRLAGSGCRASIRSAMSFSDHSLSVILPP